MNRLFTQPNRRLLIIDDTASIHEDFRKILNPEPSASTELAGLEAALFDAQQQNVAPPYELSFALQGEQGLDIAQQAAAAGQPFALAFIDMRMPPGWDGLQTIEQLWRLDPDLQIVLCTAYSDFTWETMAERLDLGDRLLILKKPFDAIEIRQMANALSVKWAMSQEVKIKLETLEMIIEQRAIELLKLSHLVQYDALTGLPNGSLLRERLQQTLSQHLREPFAVFYIGLDRFKRINNAWGYPLGDALLKAIAESLHADPRFQQRLYRQGSDQFVVVLPGRIDEAALTELVNQLLAEVRQTRLIHDEEVRVTASIGISRFPDDGDDPRTLIKRAETAMHHAKERGRNDFRLYDTELKKRAREQQHIERCLRVALEQQQFQLYYQPKVDLPSGLVTGAEALLRLQLADGTFVSPGQFIPIAEESGLIVPISRWVMREACRQTQDWHARGLTSFCTAVNVSAVDFREKDFVGGIRQVLLETGLAPSCLELEITEGVLIDEDGHTAQVLAGISELGVRLSIDDFGTGYSGLSYLRRFPVHTLKIDQSFVRDVTGDVQDAALVEAVIGIGKSLGLKVTAEGVETAEQLSFLIAKGCNDVQGFLLARPMPADELFAFAARPIDMQQFKL